MASRERNHLLQNHWSRGEATDLPQWGRSLSRLSNVTSTKPLSTAMCNGQDRGPETQSRNEDPSESRKAGIPEKL